LTEPPLITNNNQRVGRLDGDSRASQPHIALRLIRAGGTTNSSSLFFILYTTAALFSVARSANTQFYVLQIQPELLC
jgi:hypothetical protein